MMSSPIPLSEQAQEVALAEAQAVRSLASGDEYRGRLAALIAAVGEGEVGGEDAATLEELLELGLQSGRIRSVYGPEGEQAALKTYRRLPGGRALSDSASEVSEALSALAGKTLEDVAVQSTGPGSYLLTLAVDGLELSVRLDRAGARLHAVGV
jgi:hypothetical protein